MISRFVAIELFDILTVNGAAVILDASSTDASVVVLLCLCVCLCESPNALGGARSRKEKR